MDIKKTFLIFAGAALLPCATLRAQEAAPAETETATATESAPATTEEKTGKAVRVTASRHETDLADVPMSVSVVDGAEVDKSSAATLADLLDDVPGVQVSTNGPAGMKYVNIRGEGNNRTVVLVDGQRITEQKSMEGVPLLISVQDIERVEVIKGPASVLYGSDAIGGVVNVITKKVPKEDGVHGSASIRGDSGTHGIDQYYSLSGRFGDISARVSFSDEDHGNVESPAGTLENTDYRLQNTSAAIAYDISEDATVGAKFEMFRGRINTLGQAGFYPTLPGWDRDKVGVFLDVKDISKTFVKFHLDAFYQKTDKDFLQYTDPAIYEGGVDMRVLMRNKLYTYGLNAQADVSFNDEHYLIVGAMLDYQDLESSTDTTVKRPPMMTMHSITPHNDASVLTAALYAQDEWNFAEGWNLVFGGRATYVKNERDSSNKTIEMTTPRGPSVSQTYTASETDEDAHATFALSLVNTQVENWTIRGTVSQGYRYGTLNELYIGSAMGGTDGTFRPNPDLDPESSTNYEFGIRYNDGNLNVDATFFYTDSDDYIAYRDVVINGTTYSQPQNVSSAQTFGIELAASYDIHLDSDTTLTPYTSLTLMQRRYDNGEYSTYDTGTPPIFGKAGIRGTFSESNREWWADFNVRANAAADDIASSTTDAATGTISLVKETTPGWATWNVSFGVDITPERPNPYFGKFSVAVGIDNIGDHRYEIVGYSDGFWQPGRSYWASLKYEF